MKAKPVKRPAATGGELVAMQVWITRDLRRRARVTAAHCEMGLAEYVAMILDQNVPDARPINGKTSA